MAEQDVLDKLDDVLEKIADVKEKVGEVEEKVNTDSELIYVCGNCGDGLVDGAGCTHCGGTGVRKSAKISKVEE